MVSACVIADLQFPEPAFVSVSPPREELVGARFVARDGRCHTLGGTAKSAAHGRVNLNCWAASESIRMYWHSLEMLSSGRSARGKSQPRFEAPV